MPSVTVVDLYSKNDCHLCDVARAVLERIRKEIPFTLNEIKISQGHPQFDEFKESIPVVYVDGAFAFKERVDQKSLRKLLTRKRTELG